MKSILLMVLVFVMLSCGQEQTKQTENSLAEKETEETIPAEYIADAFDYPVGKPDAKGYYNAQKFGENFHLGDDWNAVTGGNSDLGDPIYNIGNGKVIFAKDAGGGWGNIIRIVHTLPDGQQYESFYAHCDTIMVEAEKWVKRGEQIGTIGNVDGLYYAHLHFEIREDLNLPIGGGYSENRLGYINPTEFIKKHRDISGK